MASEDSDLGSFSFYTHQSLYKTAKIISSLTDLQLKENVKEEDLLRIKAVNIILDQVNDILKIVKED